MHILAIRGWRRRASGEGQLRALDELIESCFVNGRRLSRINSHKVLVDLLKSNSLSSLAHSNLEDSVLVFVVPAESINFGHLLPHWLSYGLAVYLPLLEPIFIHAYRGVEVVRVGHDFRDTPGSHVPDDIQIIDGASGIIPFFWRRVLSGGSHVDRTQKMSSSYFQR